MNRRGFTLIELMISVTIMLIAVAAASLVILAGMTLSHHANALGDQDDAARFALSEIAQSLQRTGMGAPNGVYVASVGLGAVVTPIYGTDGNNIGTDDLWLVVADRDAMRDGCTVTTHSTFAPLQVRCTSVGAIAAGTAAPLAPEQILVSNMQTAALLTVTNGAPPVNSITSSEAGISDSPSKGFEPGDMAYVARVMHYYIKNDASGTPGLYVETGVTTGGTAAAPFTGAGDAKLVQQNVEDLQIKYFVDNVGVGDPTKYDQVDGLTPTNGTAAWAVRAVRVSVVVRSASFRLDNRGNKVLSDDTRPPVVENHYAGGGQPPADGYERVVYTRTIDLPNLAPWSM